MPKFSNGDRVRVSPASSSPYRGRTGVVVDDGSSSSSSTLGYMVRFEYRGLHPTARFMEEDLTAVSDEDTGQETSAEEVSTALSGQSSENQFVRVTSKTRYIYFAAIAVLVIAAIVFGIKGAGSLIGGSSVPEDFTSGSTGLPQGSSNQTNRLVFATELAGAAADQLLPVQPVVKIVDADGNTADVSLPVSLVVSNDAADLYGTTTVTTVHGVATFEDLRIIKAGPQYHLTAVSQGLTPVLSNAFTIVPGTPAQLDFTTAPYGSGLPNRFSTQVSIEDTFGNLVTDSTANVTLSITPGTGPEGAVLTGFTNQKAQGGIASFSYLSIDPPDQYYKLTATSPGLEDGISDSFKVTLVAPEQTQTQ